MEQQNTEEDSKLIEAEKPKPTQEEEMKSAIESDKVMTVSAKTPYKRYHFGDDG